MLCDSPGLLLDADDLMARICTSDGVLNMTGGPGAATTTTTMQSSLRLLRQASSPHIGSETTAAAPGADSETRATTASEQEHKLWKHEAEGIKIAHRETHERIVGGI